MLYLVRGLPGSGKSTFCFNHFNGIIHLENDMFHMIVSVEDDNVCKYQFNDNLKSQRSLDCFELSMKILRNGYPVVVSNVFPTKYSIDRYVLGAREIGHKTKIFKMISQFENQHNVPLEALKWMKENFVDYEGEHLVSAINKTTYMIK